MRKFVLAAAAIVMTSASAFASDAVGVVSRYNPEARVITLQSGQSYTIPRDIALPAIRVGEKVTFTFRHDGGEVTGVLTRPLWG